MTDDIPAHDTLEDVEADPAGDAAGDEDPVEAAVDPSVKKLASNPMAWIVMAVALLGGGTGGISFLQGQAADDFDAQDCREMIAAHAAEMAKARAAEWTAHRREEDSRYARATVVVQISTKLDGLADQLTLIREEIRTNWRRRPPQ